jgi:hypothetical protein
MTTTATNLAEPIPGYRLLERLGAGGFGEVWKVEAPGGLHKAIKIVHGNLDGDGEEEIRVRQELKALERVKTVRHPFILSLERFDIIDRRLLIVMELADRSLYERFKECQGQGLPGIPRDELLCYLEETAEALDLMNIQYQLQHLDIKPQNLFLVHNHIKVGDFGLVKDLEGMRAFATSGLTPIYAAPETFEGIISRFCDQYNLAIVYQELLTGKLPFRGTSPRHLMMQHLSGQPDLSSLPPADRPAIARALAKKPEDRHPTCGDLVRILHRGSAGERKSVCLSRPKAPAPPPAPGGEGRSKGEAPRPCDPAGGGERTTVQLAERANPPPERMATPVVVEETLPPERPEVTGDGVLFPALVIGAGGVALEVLQQLRKALHKRCGPPDVLPHVRLLYLDTDPDVVRQAPRGEPDAALTDGEVVLARLQRPTHYLKPGRERQIVEPWLNMGLLSRLPRDQVTAAGCRALGRLAFVTNYGTIAPRLRSELEACTDPAALAAAEKATGLGLRTNRPRVYIVANLAGGSGGGMFLDLAYAVRRLLRQMGYHHPDIVGLCLLPAVKGNAASVGVQNAFAALTELSHFASGQTAFSADYLDGGPTLLDSAPPFRRCLLLPLPPESNAARTASNGDGAALAALAGDFLSRDLTTPLGRVADQSRPSHGGGQAEMTFQTFGAFWFAVPRRALLQRVAQTVCYQLVQGWRTEGREAAAAAFRGWAGAQLEACALTPDGLTARLQSACVQVLGGDPEAIFDGVLARWAAGGAAELARDSKAALEALAEIERLAGGADEGLATGVSTLAAALREAVPALSAEAERQLAEVVMRVLFEPRFRLSSAEEAVYHAIGQVLREEGKRLKQAIEKLGQESEQLHATALQLLQSLGKRSFLWRGNKAHIAADLIELLRQYLRSRWKRLACEGAVTLYQELHAGLHRQVREVGCCRPRIAQLLQSFAAPPDRRQQVDLGLGRYLLPTGCRTLEEGAARVLGSLTPEELDDLREEVQGVIRETLQAHVHVCTAPASFFKNLEEEVHERVAALAEVQLGRAHAAELYLQQHGEDEAALADLTGAFDEAVPELAARRLAPRDELCILAVPPGLEGDYFRNLVRRALPERAFLPAASTDDIVFYREQPNVALSSLPQMALAVQEAYRAAGAAAPFPSHSRFDIPAWLPPRA